MQRSFRLWLDRIWSNITWRRVVVVILVLLVAAAARVAYLLWPEWTGFGEKTLWDLLELLIIPAVLGFGALWFNQAARSGEQKIASDQQREQALQNYLDKMAELLLKEKLLEKKDKSVDPVVDVAQVRTVTTLRILDQERKSILFQFLRDANLSDFLLAEASLAEADLSNTRMVSINLDGADMRATNLSDAYFRDGSMRGADLNGSKLFGAYLLGVDMKNVLMIGADLSSASLISIDLRKAQMTYVILRKAYLASVLLNGADFTGADLRGAILDWSNLEGSNITEEQLLMARSLKGTVMPDGTEHE